MQDGLTTKCRIVVVCPEVYCTAKTKESFGFINRYWNLEVLSHVKKEIGGYASQAAHNIHEHYLVDFEESHGKVIADFMDGSQLAG